MGCQRCVPECTLHHNRRKTEKYYPDTNGKLIIDEKPEQLPGSYSLQNKSQENVQAEELKCGRQYGSEKFKEN